MTKPAWVICALLVCTSTGKAAPTDRTEVGAHVTQNTVSKDVETLSAEWGLTEPEWQRYKEVMTQHKRGLWSPGLDPLTTLGVSADTSAERKRFAELYVRAEFVRVRKELAFQVAVDEAWKRLYPDTPRLLDAARSTPDTRPASRYAVVVSDDCSTCQQVIAERLKWLQNASSAEPVDVHVVGTLGDDAKLRAWVTKNRWIADALKSKRATVNHGDQFAALSQFPVVYGKKEGGQWTREL